MGVSTAKDAAITAHAEPTPLFAELNEIAITRIAIKAARPSKILVVILDMA